MKIIFIGGGITVSGMIELQLKEIRILNYSPGS